MGFFSRGNQLLPWKSIFRMKASPPRGCFRRKPARQLPFAATTPPCENGVQKRPQAFLNPEIKNNISLAYAQSNAERIQNRSAQQKSRRTKSAAALRGVTLQPALCDDPPHTGQIDPTQQMLQYDQHGILPSDRPFQPNSPFSKIRSSFVKLPPPKRLSSGPRL